MEVTGSIPVRSTLFMNLKNILLYLTNNERESRHEQEFDMVFFMVNTIALIVGIFLLIESGEPHWVPFLVIEYVWAVDNMRHNRL